MNHWCQLHYQTPRVPLVPDWFPEPELTQVPRVPTHLKGGGTREPVRSGGVPRCLGEEPRSPTHARDARRRREGPISGSVASGWLDGGAGAVFGREVGSRADLEQAVFGGVDQGPIGVQWEPPAGANRVAVLPVRPRVSIGIDQGGRSGWGIAAGRSVIASGVARTHAQRMAVLELARSRNGGTLKGVVVMFEDHSGIPLGRLTRDDHRTERTHGRRGAPERSTASILGQGSNKGRWLECLDMLEHPQALRDKVKPHVWRAKLGITGKIGTARAKLAACQIASAAAGARIDDHDQAEGVCLALFAAIDGVARFEKRKAELRTSARGVRQRARQGDLFGGAK